MNHLLRTMAAVPVSNRVLDWNCGTGTRALPLAQLGFDLYACEARPDALAQARTVVRDVLGETTDDRITSANPSALGYPDEHFDWIIAWRTLDDAADAHEMHERLAEARRVLKDGGWIYVVARAVPEDFNPATEETGYASDSAMPMAFTPDTLDALLRDADFALAEKIQREEDHAEPVVRGIYRKVSEKTPW